MADRAGKRGDAREIFIQRVRHWTRERLLRPVGETNPGTGKHRVYKEIATKEALILEAMTIRGMPIATQRFIIGVIRQELGQRAREKSDADFWLVIDTWGDHSHPYFWPPLLSPSQKDDDPKINKLADSTLAFNLTRLFAQIVPEQSTGGESG
jgi:hypothetical protein